MPRTSEEPERSPARSHLRWSRRSGGGRRDERGASAVELALVLPVFLLLVMGALQFAYVMFVRHEIYAAAQQVCRQLALGAETAASATTALQDELRRIGASGTLQVVAPTPTTDASVEISVPIASLLWTELFRPAVGDSAMQLRVVYRSTSRTS